MAFTHTLTLKIAPGADTTITKTIVQTNGMEQKLSEAVADAQTDKQLSFTLDVSAVKSFYLVSDQTVLIETNSGSTPDNTITLVADVPYVWFVGAYDTFKFTVDITALFVTNSSGSSATIEIRAIVDPTP